MNRRPPDRTNYSTTTQVSYAATMSHFRTDSNELTIPRRTSNLRLEKPSGSAALSSGLIAAAPIEALLTTFSAEIATVRRVLGDSPDVAKLERMRDALERALDEARRADVWLSPSQVAEISGKGLSTVTRDCREHGEAIGAVRNGKRGWHIHWPTYLAWMSAAQSDRRAA